MGVEEILKIVDVKRQMIQQARPLPPETVQSLKDDFVIRYAHETTAIEGNTLDIYETKVVLEDGITIGGKTIREHLEVLNIKHAITWLETTVQNAMPISEESVRRIHEIVMQGILKEDAGLYRRHAVYIRGAWHVPPNWVKVPELMGEFGSWLERGPGAEHPVIFSAKAHSELVKIHPFADGNGRTARLLVNLLLMRSDYPPAVYTSTNRAEYSRSLDRAHTAGDLEPFMRITAQAIEYMEDRYLTLIRQQEDAT